MQEEIKEILDRLERIDHKEYIAFEFADSATFNEVARCFEERKKMADYITNLQEYETIIEMEFKREYAKRYLEERRKEEPHLLYPDSDEIYKRYYELKEENESLYKELKLQKGTTRLFKNDLLNVMGNFMETELDAFEQQEKELEIYKSRNEKAIEYNKKNIHSQTLDNILQGEQNE